MSSSGRTSSTGGISCGQAQAGSDHKIPRFPRLARYGSPPESGQGQRTPAFFILRVEACFLDRLVKDMDHRVAVAQTVEDMAAQEALRASREKAALQCRSDEVRAPVEEEAGPPEPVSSAWDLVKFEGDATSTRGLGRQVSRALASEES